MSEVQLSPDSVRHLISECMRPSHFVAKSPLVLEWEYVSSETVPWEVFRGQLVSAQLTRQTRTFESWHCFGTDELGHSEEPLLSVKFDSERGELHVVRGLLCYVWEGYDSGGNVYLSREVQRWVRELVGTLCLNGDPTEENLRTDLSILLFHAVVGSSRLPLTSLEAPMPSWSLGRLAYSPIQTKEPRPQRSGSPQSLDVAVFVPKTLEFLIRSSSVDELPNAVDSFLVDWGKLGRTPQDSSRLLRTLFNEVSLSPYTDFVDKTLHFVRLLVERSHFTAEHQIDFLSWLLRQLARHLTAYDLVTFHHRGANYPDALLLDATLKEYLRLIEAHPELFAGAGQTAVTRRRALRLGWLHRRRFEGHLVTDIPTSPGENTRVLPPPHVRVPEEQILNVAKRKKLLFERDPLTDHVGPHGSGILKECGQDLKQESELRELGLAIFIERPLGSRLTPGAPVTSPLLAHEAYSQSLAERALADLSREPLLGLAEEDIQRCQELLAVTFPSGGILATELPVNPSQVVSLADAAKAAKDFVIVRTLPGSVRVFCEQDVVKRWLTKQAIKMDSREKWLIVADVSAAGEPGVTIRNASRTHFLVLGSGP